MTFSDVITLLMTFFILLLTFATNEPESFSRIETSMFGGGGTGTISDWVTVQHPAGHGEGSTVLHVIESLQDQVDLW